jgi:hypothetical protein
MSNMAGGDGLGNSNAGERLVGSKTVDCDPKNQACSHLCPLICWHLVSKKKSLPGAGGVFLTRGKWEVMAPAQREATVH